MKTAILIDGGFFIKRVRAMGLAGHHDARRMADLAVRYALLHLTHKIKNEKHTDELYRIFFYDCIPFEKKMHNPVSGKSVDFSKSAEAIFRRELHDHLRKKRKTALRLGKLSESSGWKIGPKVSGKVFEAAKKGTVISLVDSDAVLDTKQKGVDMRIGLDIASITLKKQAGRIVLMSGDSDFVPAAKLARREGIDFILDPMWNHIPKDLFEHIDGLRTICPNPFKKTI